MPDADLLLFVSHVREDRQAALEIVDALERRGVPCWIAPRDVRPGKPFDDEIAEAIEACRAMLLIFTDRCNEHEYIRREVTVAGESRKLIILFRIENAQPRRGLRVRLSDLHWVDGFVSREQAIDQVVRTIDGDRARPEEKERRRDEERQRSDEQRVRAEEQRRGQQSQPPRERPFPERAGEGFLRMQRAFGRRSVAIASVAAAVVGLVLVLALGGVFTGLTYQQATNGPRPPQATPKRPDGSAIDVIDSKQQYNFSQCASDRSWQYLSVRILRR